MKNKGNNTMREDVAQGPRVAELLRATRERAGVDLQRVADVLRIRYVYLQAIEEGRYEDLPGKTYVIGFVRAYSEYLGLDVEEVVTRFKQEVDGMAPKAELVFPSPVTEQSVPSGAIIMISLILIAIAYGGWYFLSSQDRDMAELVPDLPAKFAEMVEQVKSSAQEEEVDRVQLPEQLNPAPAAETASETEEVAAPPDTQDMAAQARKVLEEAAQNETEQTETNPPEPVETVAVEPALKPAPEEQPAAEAQGEAAESDAPGRTEPETSETGGSDTQESAQALEDTPEQAPAEDDAQTAETPPAPAAMTQKIVLRGTDYAWVQVTDSSGKVLHTQVLNDGDEYEVPAQSGLILRTGNAGGLDIFVDEAKVPSIGDAGEVRRKVLLDPQKLIAGSAVES